MEEGVLQSVLRDPVNGAKVREGRQQKPEADKDKTCSQTCEQMGLAGPEV